MGPLGVPFQLLRPGVRWCANRLRLCPYAARRRVRIFDLAFRIA